MADSLKIILGACSRRLRYRNDNAVSAGAEHVPDIALLDIQMLTRRPIGGARDPERDPAARVVLTTFSDESIVPALAGRPRLPDQNRCRRYSTGGAGHGRLKGKR